MNIAMKEKEIPSDMEGHKMLVITLVDVRSAGRWQRRKRGNVPNR
jgi:hypothetical protein